MNILVISYFFAPHTKIAAVRWTKLSKYLSEAGVSVDVITSEAMGMTDELLLKDCSRLNKIFRVEHGDDRFNAGLSDSVSPVSALPRKAQSKLILALKNSRINRWRRAFNERGQIKAGTDFSYAASVDFAAQAVKLFESGAVVIDSYDAVICSFGPVSSTILALWIKEHHPCKPLIMDFRDPMDSVTLPRKYKRLYGGLQKKICEKADAVVSVSDGCINRICPKKYKDKAYTVPNGYDPEDIGGDVLSAVYDNEKYSFAYTGALYGGKRSFAPLFKQLSSLINDGTIDRKNVIFRYAGKSFPALLEQAAQYGLEDILDNRGMITRDECLRLQRSARHLVVCTWNNRKETGVLTGKLMEYFMSGRPIIALVSGELGGSEVRRLIERGSLGIAYEQASGRTDGRLLRDYIKSDYLDFLSGKDCRSKRKEDVVSRYDYHALASGVKSVIEAAIGQKGNLR